MGKKTSIEAGISKTEAEVTQELMNFQADSLSPYWQDEVEKLLRSRVVKHIEEGLWATASRGKKLTEKREERGKKREA